MLDSETETKIRVAMSDVAAAKRRVRNAKELVEFANKELAEAQVIYGVNDTVLRNLLDEAIEHLVDEEGGV